MWRQDRYDELVALQRRRDAMEWAVFVAVVIAAPVGVALGVWLFSLFT